MDQITTWIKDNKAVAGIGAGLLILLLFGKKLLGTTRRRRRRVKPVVRRRRTRRMKPATTRTRTRTRKGTKKPWQVKGSIAARRHMAKLRRMK